MLNYYVKGVVDYDPAKQYSTILLVSYCNLYVIICKVQKQRMLDNSDEDNIKDNKHQQVPILSLTHIHYYQKLSLMYIQCFLQHY